MNAVVTAAKEVTIPIVALTPFLHIYGSGFPARTRYLQITFSQGEVAELAMTVQTFLGENACNCPSAMMAEEWREQSIAAFAYSPAFRDLVTEKTKILPNSEGNTLPLDDEQRLLRIQITSQIVPTLLVLNAHGITYKRDEGHSVHTYLMSALREKRGEKFFKHAHLFSTYAGKFHEGLLSGYCNSKKRSNCIPQPGSGDELFGVGLLDGRSYEETLKVLTNAVRPHGPFFGIVNPTIFKAG